MQTKSVHKLQSCQQWDYDDFVMEHLGKPKLENATSPLTSVHRVKGLNGLQKSQNRNMIVIFGIPFENF